MKLAVILGFIGTLCVIPCARSEPLANGVPEAAIAPLKGALAQASNDSDRTALAEKLVEALFGSQRFTEAMQLLEQPVLRDSVTGKFFRAQTLAALGRIDEAAAQYREVSQTPGKYRSASALGEAEMLRARGNIDDALKGYAQLFADSEFATTSRLRSAELLLSRGELANAHRMLEEAEPTRLAEKRERRCLRGRFELASGHADRAIGVLQPLLGRIDGTPHTVIVAALLALADAHLALRTPEAGDDFLEDYIEHHANDPALPEIFAKLDQLYTLEKKPGRGELERWAHDAAQPRRALSQWYVARLELRGGRRERALRDFDEMARTERLPLEAIPAFMEYAKLLMADRNFNRALEVLGIAKSLRPAPDLAARLDFIVGRAHEFAGDAKSAAAAFDRATVHDGPLTQTSALNASLAWLQVADDAQVQSHAGNLTASAREDLALEEGLALANRKDARAEEALRKFSHDFPENPRTSEALVALAELAFHSAPPRLKEARADLELALQSRPTDIARERAAYLDLWIQDGAVDADEKVIALATAFLRDHATSAFAADVRMKLAETYFRRQDFANAQTQFELLAQQNPKAPLADKALFFAAQCASASFDPNAVDRSLALLSQVVRSDSSFKWAARNQQAAIERRLGKLDEALVLYDEVLKNDARIAEKREALCGKGDIYLELGARDRANYARAIDCYTKLAADTEGAPHWRNQALYKQAVCLEKQDDRDAALATFYRIIDVQPGDKPTEFFWYYKAGFDAARLLEETAKWDSVVSVYQRLASSGGSRSGEAKDQLDRIRLEHFLWKE